MGLHESLKQHPQHCQPHRHPVQLAPDAAAQGIYPPFAHMEPPVNAATNSLKARSSNPAFSSRACLAVTATAAPRVCSMKRSRSLRQLNALRLPACERFPVRGLTGPTKAGSLPCAAHAKYLMLPLTADEPVDIPPGQFQNERVPLRVVALGVLRRFLDFVGDAFLSRKINAGLVGPYACPDQADEKEYFGGAHGEGTPARDTDGRY